ncbi:MAG: O-methyltransferase [Eubacterium sp.]|nr:O-methyltransferase [Candidatus Colimonas fimequi]
MSTYNITNQVVEEYIYSLYKCGNKELADLRDFAEQEHVKIIQRDVEELILNLLRIKKPSRLLEIGSAIGYSACTFVNGCGCDVTTIEIDPDIAEDARVNIKKFGFEDKIEVLVGDASEVLKDLEGPYDVVFIDAAKSYYKYYWDRACELLTDGGLIICDNILMKGMTASSEFDRRKRYKTSIRHMRNFLEYITNQEYADTCVLSVGDGVSLSVITKNE